VPLATVVAGATTITSVTDIGSVRVSWRGEQRRQRPRSSRGRSPSRRRRFVAGSIVMTSRKTIGGTTGTMSYTLTAGTGFTLNSSSATDTSTISWFII